MANDCHLIFLVDDSTFPDDVVRNCDWDEVTSSGKSTLRKIQQQLSKCHCKLEADVVVF